MTSGKGTSYAAPMLANKAAELLRLFPTASANLIRALLAGHPAFPMHAPAVWQVWMRPIRHVYAATGWWTRCGPPIPTITG
ncbi:hypothetical protein FLP41_03440 (plasmid) [Paracoccus marcusii]|uniref:hypothetical protein n=1 Tax=Paracoccus marcusii TaxID=59779 RepID=UPI002ED5ACC5|nr:hypothetical protein FLP41_03440 [Paracoccus marcusii]